MLETTDGVTVTSVIRGNIRVFLIFKPSGTEGGKLGADSANLEQSKWFSVIIRPKPEIMIFNKWKKTYIL